MIRRRLSGPVLLALCGCAATEPQGTDGIPPFVSQAVAVVDDLVMSALRFSIAGTDVGGLPDSLLGGTLVWDCDLAGYYRHPEALGAPPDGVRMVLYTVDDVGRPVCPLTMLAFLDVTPFDTAGQPAVRVEVADLYGRAPLASFAVWRAPVGDSAGLALAGWLGFGRERIRLAGASGHPVEGPDSIAVAHPAAGWWIVLERWAVEYAAQPSERSSLTISDGADTVRVLKEIRDDPEDRIRVFIELNGALIRAVTCCPGDTIAAVTGDGQAVRRAERLQLEWLMFGDVSLRILFLGWPFRSLLLGP